VLSHDQIPPTSRPTDAELPVAAFGAHQVPAVLKPVVLLGITQARGWHVGTLNELRKFLGLKPHRTFEDINPDPETQRAMKELYKHPDFVEMYPGILFEQTKVPVCPGSGLCAGFTTIRAILSDAVTLVRGDRFYTLVSLFLPSICSCRPVARPIPEVITRAKCPPS